MKRIGSLVLCAAMLLMLASCGATTAYEKSSSADSTGVEAASGDVSGLTIAYSAIAKDEAPWANVLWEKLEEVCAEKSWTFTGLSAGGVASEQEQQIDDLIAQDPDYFLILAGDATMANEWVKEIHNAGIPVILLGIDTSGEYAQYVSAFVGADQEALASQLATDMIAKYGASSALNVAAISGFAEQRDYQLREQGIEKTLSYFSNYSLLATDYAGASEDNANSIMNSYISTYGEDIDAVISYDDTFTLGVLSALEEADMDVPVYSIGGTTEVLEAVKSGEVEEVAYVSATEMAEKTADVITNLANGIIPDHYQYTERTYVTSENVEEYLEKAEY